MKKFWMGIAIGALVGGAAALLYAPQSGRSTRRSLRRSLGDVGDTLSDAAEFFRDQAERLSGEAQRLVNGGKGQIGDVLEATQDYAKAARSQVHAVSTRLM